MPIMISGSSDRYHNFKKSEKNIRIVHCSIQSWEVRSPIIGFLIEDTGMSIMISGPRIDIITRKIEIGQYKKKKYIDGTQ